MEITYKSPDQEIFGKILESLVGAKLVCGDGSGMPDFILRKRDVAPIAENLAQWFSEQYPGTRLTVNDAKKYIDETYPVA
jgi:hypothetical protein